MTECGASLRWLLREFMPRAAPGLTTKRVVETIVKPATEARQCRYVDLVSEVELISKPTHFISHCWQAEFAATMAAVAEYFSHDTPGAWDDIFVWVDILVSQGAQRLRCLLA